MSIIIMILLLSFLVLIHELGHFLAAKAFGMKVDKFGFGLPLGPTLFEKKIGQEEVYVLRAGHARIHALRAAAEGIRERLFPGQYGFFSDIALDDF